MEQQIHSIHTGFDDPAKLDIHETAREHECIFTLVSVFLSLAKLGTDASRLFALFERINEQTVSHFHEEENVLRRSGHPNFATQCADHCRILEDLMSFRNRVASGQIVLTSEYLHVFDSLMIHHVREDLMHNWDQIDRPSSGLSAVWQGMAALDFAPAV